MGIEIILYDSSPVTQKIFFHILYHYRPIVHRIDQTSKLMEKVQHSIPDIIFIDAAFSNDIKNQINKKKEQLKNVPIILMAKEDLNQEELESSVAQGFLKKPIEAGKLRELVNRLVPKTKNNVLMKHLKFPPPPDFKEEKTKQEEDSGFSSKNTAKQSEYEKNIPLSSDKNQTADETIQPITMKEELSDQTDNPPEEINQTPDQFPQNEGIKPVTTTQVSDQPDNPPEEINQTPDQKSDQPSDNDARISPISTIQVTNDEEQDSPPVESLKQSPYPSTEKEIDTTHNEEKKSATDVKILHVSSQSKSTNKESTLEDPSLNTHLKDQITEEVKVWANRKIKEEVEKQLKYLITENSQDIIQKITEKAVWQVVPELAKQLITKELDKLLKEEEEKPENSDNNDE